MPPCPCCWATLHHHRWATSRLHHRATTHPDLWHLLGQRLTWTIIVSFHLHLNQQKIAGATQLTLNLPFVLSFCDCAMDSMSEGIYNTPHQEQCVARLWGKKISKMLPCAHKGCTARVHKLCQIDWLQRHGLEVVHNDPIFCRQHNRCYQNYVWLHPAFSLRRRYPTSYSNPGAQGE